MELSDTLRALVRRWYVLLLGLLLTAGAGWAVHRAVPTTYQATGSILLMPSPVMVGDAGNPYLYLGGMRDVLDVVIRRSDAEQVREGLLAPYEGSDYEVAPDATTQSPIIVVTAESLSPEDAVALLQAALVTVGSNLDAMQDELTLPEANRIQRRELVVDATATADNSTARQATIATVGAGLLGTLLLTGFVDGRLLRRRARRTAPRNQAADTDATVTEPSGREVAVNRPRRQRRWRAGLGPVTETSGREASVNETAGPETAGNVHEPDPAPPTRVVEPDDAEVDDRPRGPDRRPVAVGGRNLPPNR